MGWFEERAGLDGTVAAVIGGAGGLGEAISVDLAANGVRLAVIDIDESGVNKLRQTLEKRDCEALIRCGDARDAEALASLFAAVDERWGRLDTLVNVVGGTFQSNCVVFLASALSAYITGTTLHPDGGVLASGGWFNWPGSGWGILPMRVAEYLSGSE